MWRFTELDHRRPDLNPAAGRQVGETEIEVHEELIAGQGPALALAGDGSRGPRVHQGHLRLRVRSAVGRPAAATRAPAVAHEAVVKGEPGFGEDLALIYGGSHGDQLDRAAVGRRLANVVESLLESSQLVGWVHMHILP